MLKLINKIMGQKTSSPKGGKRGCVCKDGTYSSKCCNGELSEQGIGALTNQQVVVTTNTDNTRTITNVSS
jgi:hypothetical protein